MKTASAWGTVPSRFYKLMRRIEASVPRQLSACVVGCSDGKFVLPLLRRGHRVAAYDIDKTALFGGYKPFPLPRRHTKRPRYKSYKQSEAFPILPHECRHIPGLRNRVESEQLAHLVSIHHHDFFHSPPGGSFDLVFTSCSIQYRLNNDLPAARILGVLQDHVAGGGYLALDYMLPLEDSHTWKRPLFLRTGTMRTFFSDDACRVLHWRESQRPIFEAAHVDRPQDHYHRFGYLVAVKRDDDA